jgi:hypothetical protein
MNRLFLLLGTLLCLALPSCEQFDVPTLTPPGPSSPVDLEISPCDDGESIDVSQVPQAIIDFLDENYPNSDISDVDLYQFVNNVLAYAIELDDDLEILFDENGLVISASNDDDDDDIAIADLPAAVIEYIAANYPDASIDEAEFDDYYGTTYIEVELDQFDDLELYFTTDGVFLCLDDSNDDDDDDNGDDGDDDGDNDDDDDDDDGDDDNGDDDDGYQGTVPGPIADFVNANYPDYYIEDIDDEDICDDVPAIEVELEGPDPDPELYFDTDYNFLFVSYDINASALPDPVLAELEAQFPGYSLEDDDLERHEYPNGDIEYRVKLELPGDDDEIEVVLTETGTIVCTDD